MEAEGDVAVPGSIMAVCMPRKRKVLRHSAILF